MEMGQPSKENTAEKIKGESWGHKTREIEHWQRLRRIARTK